jgi:GNAT superfamily N-acetyltransferase
MDEAFLTIERAGPSRRDELVPLFLAQFGEHAIDTPGDGVLRAIDGAFAHPERAAILVASLGARAVGVVYLAFIWTVEHAGRAAWLEELYVSPDHRGRGIGEKLLAAAIDLARREGCRAMDLEVEEDHGRVESLYARDHGRVESLYARAGFRRHTRRRFVLRLA